MGKASKKAILSIIDKTNGNISACARSLGMSRVALYKRIDNDPDLKQALTDCRDRLIDIAENKLTDLVLSGYYPAIALVLRTIGKSRGYGEEFTMHDQVIFKVISDEDNG